MFKTYDSVRNKKILFIKIKVFGANWFSGIFLEVHSILDENVRI
jgi:hypothetical protein